MSSLAKNEPTASAITPEQALEQFVTRALEEQGRMNNGGRARVYQTLLSQLSTAGAPRYYTALAKCASLIKSETNSPLNSPFSALLNVVFEVDYRTSSLETAVAHVNFLLHLALANSGLMPPCFRVFCQSFKYEEWEARDQVHEAIHVALRQILHLSPIASSSLFTVFLEVYPHQRVDTSVQHVFIKNLLNVALESESLRTRILSLVMERLVALDVEVAGSLEGAETKILPDPSELAGKLDQLLELLFKFLAWVRDLKAPKAPEIRNSIWDCLCSVFNKTILKAHKARYLPFLVFYHARTYAKYSDKFIRLLINKAGDMQSSEPERILAAVYLAGFVTRAAFIHAVQLRIVFERIVEDLHAYCLDQEDLLSEEDLEQQLKIGPANAPAHIVFYAEFQALMYMFVKRLCEDPEILEKTVHWERLQHIIRSYLCPFRYCLPETVAEFREKTAELELLPELEAPSSSVIKALDDLLYVPFEPLPLYLPLCAEYINEHSLYLASPSLDSDAFLAPEVGPRSKDKSPALHSVATPLLRTPLTGPAFSDNDPTEPFLL